MAVVFISPKQRQKMFFMGITAMFLLILVVIALIVFLAQPQQVPAVMVFNKPKVNIDFTVLDSDQFQKLVPFEQMQTQFSYTATTAQGKSVNGFIAAVSLDVATQTLQSMGFTVDKIQEVQIGRDNPFVPYYQSSPVVATPTKTKTTSKTK